MAVLSGAKTLNADGTTSTLTGGEGGGGPPSGDAGGVLDGTYPDPSFAVDMATQAELNTVSGAKQDLDSDLTAIAGLTPNNDDVVQRKSGVWVARTMAQVKTDLALVKADVGLGSVDNTADSAKPVSTAQQTALDGKQTVDSDLTTIAGLTATTDSILQSKSSAWTTRTPAQLKTDLALVKGDVGLGSVDNTADTAKPVSTAQQTALDGKQPLDSDLTSIAALTTTAYGRGFLDLADAAAARTKTGAAASTHSHAQADVTNLTTDLGNKQPLDTDLTTIAGLTATTDMIIQSKASAWSARTPAQFKTDLALVKADVGLGSVDNTTDAGKPVSTAQQTALDLKANLTRVPNSSYRTLLDSSGSHIAARVAGTYGFGQGDPLAISGTGTLYPLNTIYIAAADYPTLDGVAAKLRVRANLHCNDTAPTGTYVFALHPVTRPTTSGGAGLVIYTIGAAVTGSAATTISTPAVDTSNTTVGSDFALPSDGYYVLGMVQTGTVAASAHMHMSAFLQMRNA